MERQELYEYFKERGTDRPVWVRENRDELMEHLNVDEPIPGEEASTYEVRDWLERYRSTISRQLNDDSDDADPHDEQEREDGDTPNTDAAEQEG